MGSVRVVPASSLSTISIPLSSAGGLKLRPVDLLQHKQIKARVIPTPYRLSTSPCNRVPVNLGKVSPGGTMRLQTVRLMSLRDSNNSAGKTIQIVSPIKKDVEETVTGPSQNS
eukprot:TRINITY_DN23281_c0_g1_i2.p2 TRINITY_DN23281_c0_g1~~TRINITY_DN23281_c0_g1_i2.p2  ORF type:complete len:113 (-),score=7.25 TRINITY_DN23281_c0_g1_i2:184-522(-)